MKYTTVADHIVVLYGNGGGYLYAEWYYNGYEFELVFKEALSENEIVSIVASVTQYK